LNIKRTQGTILILSSLSHSPIGAEDPLSSEYPISISLHIQGKIFEELYVNFPALPEITSVDHKFFIRKQLQSNSPYI
jgi:hypothetical protein